MTNATWWMGDMGVLNNWKKRCFLHFRRASYQWGQHWLPKTTAVKSDWTRPQLTRAQLLCKNVSLKPGPAGSSEEAAGGTFDEQLLSVAAQQGARQEGRKVHKRLPQQGRHFLQGSLQLGGNAVKTNKSQQESPKKRQEAWSRPRIAALPSTWRPSVVDITVRKGLADNFNANPIFQRVSDLPYTSSNILKNHKHMHVLLILFHANRFYLSH